MYRDLEIIVLLSIGGRRTKGRRKRMERGTSPPPPPPPLQLTLPLLRNLSSSSTFSIVGVTTCSLLLFLPPPPLQLFIDKPSATVLEKLGKFSCLAQHPLAFILTTSRAFTVTANFSSFQERFFFFCSGRKGEISATCSSRSPSPFTMSRSHLGASACTAC